MRPSEFVGLHIIDKILVVFHSYDGCVYIIQVPTLFPPSFPAATRLYWGPSTAPCLFRAPCLFWAESRGGRKPPEGKGNVSLFKLHCGSEVQTMCWSTGSSISRGSKHSPRESCRGSKQFVREGTSSTCVDAEPLYLVIRKKRIPYNACCRRY